MSLKHIIQLSVVLILLTVTFATASSAKASSYCYNTYVVQSGDWLAKIARHCGITLSSLYAANQWVGYYIYPGQVLVIPGGIPNSYCGPSNNNYGTYYVVCRGDTLGGIARYYGVSVWYLQQLNGIPNANRIYPGQTIRVY